MNITRRALMGFPAALLAGLPETGNTLVMVQMAGGNDGLNTVVPFEDDQYGRARFTLRLTARQVRKIAPGVGLHPEMSGFERLFKEGRLAIVQSVGYSRMPRDHGVAMRIWQTATPAPYVQETGWLGRVADRLAAPEIGNVPAVFVGGMALPLTLHTRSAIIPCLGRASEWTLSVDIGGAHPAWEKARKVASVLKRQDTFRYPACSLAHSFREVAQLIRAKLGVVVFLVEHGGPAPGAYDHHSNQVGHHAVMLGELSGSITAFCEDLERDGLLSQVLVVTYSEFGRTLAENGRHGTNHGAAAPVFLAGGKVKGGLHGAPPDLKDLENGAPKPQIDFRALYAAILQFWLGIPDPSSIIPDCPSPVPGLF